MYFVKFNVIFRMLSSTMENTKTENVRKVKFAFVYYESNNSASTKVNFRQSTTNLHSGGL